MPTFTELGMPEVEMTIWTGMASPAGLRPEIAEWLQVEVSKILHDPAALAVSREGGREKMAVRRQAIDLSETLSGGAGTWAK